MIENKEVVEQTWKNRFAKNGETSRSENFERIANAFANTDEEFVDFYDVLSNEFVCLGGRAMSNAGLGGGLTYNNCYVQSPIKDSLEDIFDKVKIGALTHQSGGGIGYDFSTLRPKGAETNNDAIASGPMSFVKCFDTETSTILQGGRMGANMGVLSVYHPDIEEFIKAKSQDGEAFKHFNFSVMIDDDFMEAVNNDRTINLRFPVYDEAGNFTTAEEWKICKNIEAKYLWNLITETAHNTGEPGVLFYDNMNKDNSIGYIEKITHTNPCVTGDTLILTDKGYEPIKERVGKKTNIWNGETWSPVTPKVTGENQQILEISLSDGHSIKCTPYHKFILNNGEKVEAAVLKGGEKLIKWQTPILDNTFSPLEIGYKKYYYTCGFFSGDGTKLENKTKHDCDMIPLYGEKINLLEYLTYERTLNQSNRLMAILDTNFHYDKQYVPSGLISIQNRLAWLSGLIDSDGSVTHDGSVTITSINKPFLNKVHLLLNTLGCHGHLNKMYEPKEKYMPDGKGGLKKYNCKACYRLSISANEAQALKQLGLDTHRIQIMHHPQREARRFVTVKNVSMAGTAEKVYCFNEPLLHQGVFNGILTGNCGEFVSGIISGTTTVDILDDETNEWNLDPDNYAGSCNLGSIMLHNLVKDPFTKYATIDWINLKESIETLVRMLDNIIDKNHYPYEPFENYQKALRTIGVGVMGLADALVMMNIKYGSEEGIEFTDDLMERIAFYAFSASVQLAKEKEPFTLLDKKKYVNNGFINKQIKRFGEWERKDNYDRLLDWTELKEQIEEHGIRNAKIMSVAPTGTISIAFGRYCAGGIEPIFALETKRTIKMDGQKEEEKILRNRAVELYKEIETITNTEIIPFDDLPWVTALELNPLEHIEMLEVVAKNVDMSVSKTINIPEYFTLEQTQEIYKECWNRGIKGVSIFRPNELRRGILEDANNTDEPASPELKETRSEAHTEACNECVLGRGDVVEINNVLLGSKETLTTGCGKIHWSVFVDKDTGEPHETFADWSKGGCRAMQEGISRLMSKALRSGMLWEEGVDALTSVYPCKTYVDANNTSQGTSCPAALGYSLQKQMEELHDEFFDSRDDLVERGLEDGVVDLNIKFDSTFVGANVGDIAQRPIPKDSYMQECPECKRMSVKNEGGCVVCTLCGFTKC